MELWRVLAGIDVEKKTWLVNIGLINSCKLLYEWNLEKAFKMGGLVLKYLSKWKTNRESARDVSYASGYKLYLLVV